MQRYRHAGWWRLLGTQLSGMSLNFAGTSCLSCWILCSGQWAGFAEVLRWVLINDHIEKIFSPCTMITQICCCYLITPVLTRATVRSNIDSYSDTPREDRVTRNNTSFKNIASSPYARHIKLLKHLCSDKSSWKDFLEEEAVLPTYCFFHKGSLPGIMQLRRLRGGMSLYTSTLNMAVGSIRPMLDSPRLKRNQTVCLQNVPEWSKDLWWSTAEIPFVSNPFKTSVDPVWFAVSGNPVSSAFIDPTPINCLPINNLRQTDYWD